MTTNNGYGHHRVSMGIEALDPTIVTETAGRFSYRATWKRMLDLVVAILGLIGTLPIWLAVAIAIRIESPGPTLFAQERVGLNGRHFRFLKFRSMYVDAEERLAALRDRNEVDGPVFKIRNDPRVTRVGRLLRRTSLDEVPQLLNVIRGEMSLVGPRPPLPSEVEHYRPEDRVRLTVVPGITCLWQINGRSECSFDRWMEYDRQYIAGMSFGLDLSILMRTLWAVLNARGAY